MPKQVQMPVFLVAVPMRMVVKLGATLGVNQVVWWVVLELKHFAIRDPALNQGTTLRSHCDERQDTGARAAQRPGDLRVGSSAPIASEMC